MSFLPCPFCGSAVEPLFTGSAYGRYFECSECGAECPRAITDDWNDAKKAWNRRASSVDERQRAIPAFQWPSGTRPVVTINLRGDVVINDDIEDAPLLTITGHNGVSAEQFWSALSSAPKAR